MRAHDAAAKADIILREIDALPTLPSVAARLLAVTSGDDPDLKEVIRLIETDPALTGRVLSLCARASLGVSQKVTTVERAVVLLGLHSVQSAVLSVQIADWVRTAGEARGRGSPEGDERDARQGTGRGFDQVGFWKHSIAVACAAEAIARAHPSLGVRPGEAFVAGLVHDIGKPALELALPRAYARVIELGERQGADIAEVEERVLGVDHRTAGGRLAERWGLPDAFRDVISLHGEDPGLLPVEVDHDLISVVTVADAHCRRLHLGWSGDFSSPPPLEALCAAAGLDAEKVEAATPRIVEEMGGRCRDLGLESQPSTELLLESVLAANRQLGRLNAKLTRTQARLAEAEAMARLGELTAGAAHEMNNPLAVISGRAQLLASRMTADADKAAAGAIVGAAQRLTDLITRLHMIAVPPTPKFGAVSLTDLMTLVVRDAKERAGIGVAGLLPAGAIPTSTDGPNAALSGFRAGLMGVRVTFSGPPHPLPAARMDRDLMRRAVLEPVVNALEAGGREPVEIRVFVERADREVLVIEVRDRGPGMSEHTLRHAFDPFFSHKPAGRQPGLGLPTARRLVELHAGRIALESTPGVGTTVRIELPDWRWRPLDTAMPGSATGVVSGPRGEVDDGGEAFIREAA